jgi:YidC/Oxa1 family membrane protein insertase
MGGITYLLPVLVAFTMWLQSKMMTPPGTDPQAQSMNQSMTTMMPLMFGFFSLNFATGLSFYFIVSNIIGVITQGFISGWSGLKFWKGWSLSKLMQGGLFGGRAAQSPSAKGGQGAPSQAQRGTTSGSGDVRKKKRRRKR